MPRSSFWAAFFSNWFTSSAVVARFTSKTQSVSDAFASDATKQTQWAAFIRRNSLTGLPGKFAEVVVAVRDYLTPVLRG